MTESEFRKLPSVDKITSDRRIRQLESAYPHDLMIDVIRGRLEDERSSIADGNSCLSIEKMVDSIIQKLNRLESPGLRPVINATGVILHTNLGRAPLSRETLTAMDTVSKGYSNLEFDLDSGNRGSRYVHIEELLCQLTGAEAALVVNNNASAVLLALTALARRKEVIVSRGEAVEIGGSFRIPDVMRQSGAKLIEVGTTNCTYINDYEQAITERTVGMMRVHSSNFQVIGFTHSTTLNELAELGNNRGIPVLDDLGSGCFLDTTAYGLAPEPAVQQSVSSGVSLVMFSGDKLVGGPQAGIIAGKKQLIDKLKKHPLARAVRIDKVRLAGLAATLLHYLKGEAEDKVPVWQMLAAPLAGIEKRAQSWADAIGEPAEVIDGESMVGGGSLPGSTLPTKLVSIGNVEKISAGKVRKIARELRNQEIPVIGRIHEDLLLLDPRTVLPEEDKVVLKSLKKLCLS